MWCWSSVCGVRIWNLRKCRCFSYVVLCLVMNGVTVCAWFVALWGEKDLDTLSRSQTEMYNNQSEKNLFLTLARRNIAEKKTSISFWWRANSKCYGYGPWTSVQKLKMRSIFTTQLLLVKGLMLICLTLCVLDVKMVYMRGSLDRLSQRNIHIAIIIIANCE